MQDNYIVSTDLDGTLIDHHSYSFEAALPALERCEALAIPVILNTSKTYQEVIALQTKLALTAPLIVENGSALFLPSEQESDEKRCQVFGVPRADILDFIRFIRASFDWRFEGFNDWSISDIAAHTGLSLEQAEQANSKQFSEPFIWHDTDDALDQLIGLAKERGFKVLKGGRFYHLQGNTDKAKPLQWLLKNYRRVFPLNKQFGNCVPKLVSLGDSHNDVAMLNVADIPVCVRSPVADYPLLSTENTIIYTQGYGPVGWAEAIFAITNR